MGRLKVSLRKTGDTDSDPYGSKHNTAGLPWVFPILPPVKKRI